MLPNETERVCGCGLPMSRNPHPDAGLPNDAGTAVGYQYECIPCLVKVRNRVGAQWREAQAENERLREMVHAIVGSAYGETTYPGGCTTTEVLASAVNTASEFLGYERRIGVD